MKFESETICNLREKAKAAGLGDLPAEYFLMKTGDIPFPERIRIEPTNRCNIRCAICPTNDVPAEQKGFMDIPLYEKILDELEKVKPGASFFITLYIGGEPLMHRRITDMVRAAAARGHYTHLNTNCLLLTEELSEELITAGLNRIIFSFDDMAPEVFGEIRRGSDYNRVYENIKMFVRVREKIGGSGPEMIVSALKIPVDADRELLFERQPRISHEFVKMFRGLPVKIMGNWAHHWASDFAAGVRGMPELPLLEAYYPCGLLWSEISVRWDGTVIPCCYDLRTERPLGRFPEAGLAEIWNGRDYTALREAHTSGKVAEVQLCRGCSMLRRRGAMDRLLGEKAEVFKINI